MKKKRIIIEWIIVSFILLIILPFLNVKVSTDGDELYNFLRIQIIYINPVILLSLVISQIWRVKRKPMADK